MSTRSSAGFRAGVLLTAALLVAGAGVLGTRARADESMTPTGSVRVRVGARVDSVPLELYVERAVANETYASWPSEALKAQAVVARTYALHERMRNRDLDYDVESSVVSQRYSSAPVDGRIRSATTATRGEYLGFPRAPILAVFHASAGGQTASSEEVWGRPLPYLRIVDSPDQDGPDYYWSFDISRADLSHAFGLRAVPTGLPRVTERSPSGRVIRMRLGTREFTGREVRRQLGGRALRSTRFEVRELGDRIRFVGSGSGHGVGLCQWGTRAMAASGETYREILAHYYPGTRLVGRRFQPGGNAE